MNSVSSVACIKAASEKEERERKALSSDEDTFTRRCVRIIANNDDGAFGDDRLELGDTVDGIVVDISVCTSTNVSIVL